LVLIKKIKKGENPFLPLYSQHPAQFSTMPVPESGNMISWVINIGCHTSVVNESTFGEESESNLNFVISVNS
jgi:hypothetical protein